MNNVNPDEELTLVAHLFTTVHIVLFQSQQTVTSHTLKTTLKTKVVFQLSWNITIPSLIDNLYPYTAGVHWVPRNTGKKRQLATHSSTSSA